MAWHLPKLQNASSIERIRVYCPNLWNSCVLGQNINNEGVDAHAHNVRTAWGVKDTNEGGDADPAPRTYQRIPGASASGPVASQAKEDVRMTPLGISSEKDMIVTAT